ncbi:lipid II:glycine glycyltransferase FemX [Pseudoglutamicibacter cumminsii]|uniref:lipid II:glycine glycyltransferase FemX n=1 Tax=Pseudoglutamicibacter cumminsii TaxID=156979 RepID=UPI00195AE9EF|nr:peptidoglycan bridge formation glycyltransferase FemA/FemB family protein [Pseudoglutamicibacter cumminsii]MBM7795756.1 lipid II:glycine glycyltransferase (peptidoglycan interpeptide bridge formation enzyme) [Pseudoglutamicibacter cumminsii]
MAETTSPLNAPLIKAREISTEEHLEFLAQHPDASFMQTPAWGGVKSDWDPVSLGIYAGEKLVGSALVLLRWAPVIKRCLAYVPMGPVIDWSEYPADAVVDALVEDVKRRGAFALRFGPNVKLKRWASAGVRKVQGAGTMQTLDELEPTETYELGAQLTDAFRARGARPLGGGLDFEAGQPACLALVPLVDDQGNQLDLEGALKSFSSGDRRNARKARRVGFVVHENPDNVFARFSALMDATGKRQDFRPRPASYYETLYKELNDQEPGSCRIFIASAPDDENHDLAAVMLVMRGNQAWYPYGGSVQDRTYSGAPRLLQTVMIEAAIERGCVVLDQGGVTSTLQMGGEHAGGLTHFKTGLGADIFRMVGEWEIAISKPITWAFNKYMDIRSK